MEKMELMIHDIIKQFKKYTFINASKNIIYNVINREKKLSFGSLYPDSIVYVIRSIDESSRFYIGSKHNLLANYFYVLSHVIHAYNNGWIPVVDQLNYPTYISSLNTINNTSNSWEYFWSQPSHISLQEAYQAKNVILSKRSWFGENDLGYQVANYYDNKLIKLYNNYSSCIKYNTTTQSYIDKQCNFLFDNKTKILGVNVRFGGHSQQCINHGAGHPIQPEIDDLLSYVDIKLNEWNMNYVFVASDNELAIRKFKEKFGSLLIYLKRNRSELGKEYDFDCNKTMYSRENIYQTTLDYLTEVTLLSKCNAIIGTITSGLRYSIVMNNNKYDNVDILDYGLFEDFRKR